MMLISNSIRLIIVVMYFLLSSYVTFASIGHGEEITGNEAGWVGPFIAVLIISVAIILAKLIRKK